MSYLTLKLIHIVSAAVLLGTGAGIAFFMLMAIRSGNLTVIRVTLKHVVLADGVFTAPAVVVQLATGILLMQALHYPFNSLWFYWVISLYLFVGLCWLPVVIIQIKLKNLAELTLADRKFKKLFTAWVVLGIPAFLAVIVLFYFMVHKPFLLA